MRWPEMLSLATAGTLSTLLYFHRYVHPEQHASIAESLHSPLRIARYATAYLGSAWLREHHRAAEIIGLGGLILALAAVVLLVLQARRQVFALQLALTLLFCAATAAITALGRLNFGVEQAFSSRYQTVALLFWGAIGMALLMFAFSSRRRWTALVAEICLIVILARGAVLARYPIREARQHGFELNASAMALIIGVYDSEQFFWIGLVREQYLLIATHLLRDDHLSIFSGNLPAELGQPLYSIFRAAPQEACAGVVESNVALAENDWPGHRLKGWAWDKLHGRPATSIVIARDGIISGFGAVGRRIPTSQPLPLGVSSRYIGYTAYVQPYRAPDSIDTYAVLASEPPSVCLIATAH